MKQKLKRIVVDILGGPEAKATTVVRSFLKRDGKSSPPKKADLAKAFLPNGPHPSEFSINLGAAPCNHTCLFCPQSVKKPKKAAWMDMKLLEKVLSEMPEEGVGLNISSYNETLAAPNLVEAVTLMKKIRPKLRICMATNGSLWKEKTIKELLSLGLDQYQLSMDAPTRESYETLMQVDHFERTFTNLERLVQLKEELNSDVKITTHVMEFAEITEENDKFVAMIDEKFNGKVEVTKRRVANWGGNWGLMETLKTKGFTADYEPPAVRYPCTSIFMHFKIQHDGRYAPCVASVPDYSADEEQHNVPYLGDAREMTWTEAWEKLSDMRQAHLQGKWDEMECCKDCNVWGLWPDFWDKKGDHYVIEDSVEYAD